MFKQIVLGFLFLVLGGVGLAQGQTTNASYTVLASAVQTTTPVVTADQTNLYYRGGHVIINVSAFTAGTYTPTIQGKNPITGAYYDILVGPAIGSTGVTVLKVYPGIATLANGAASDTLPKVWRVSLAGAAGQSMTLSIAASLEN